MDANRDVPHRRIRVDLYTPAETAIRNAIIEVEKVGAAPLLTDVVLLLGRAQDKLQDHLLGSRFPSSHTVPGRISGHDL